MRSAVGTLGAMILVMFISAPTSAQSEANRATDQERRLLAQTTARASMLLNSYWSQQFRAAGYTYSPPSLVGYVGHTKTGCHPPGQEAGRDVAFYCPADRTVYYEEASLALRIRLVTREADGDGRHSDGSEAVIITMAHEWGHAVHDQLSRQPNIRKPTPNTAGLRFGPGLNFDSSLPQEGEADCLAGVFLGEMQRAGKIPEGYSLASHTEAMRFIFVLQDRGPRGTEDECVERAFTRYGGTSQEFFAAAEACLLMQAAPDAHGNMQTRFGRFTNGLYDAAPLPGLFNPTGPLKCGPLVNAWLARGPAKNVNVNAYCNGMGSGMMLVLRASPAAERRKARTQLPPDFLSLDIFCLEDALDNTPTH